MFGFLERNRLIRKGLASGKTRRKRSQNEMLRTLETGVLAKWVILVAFVIGLWAVTDLGGSGFAATQFLAAFLIFLVALVQLWINHPKTFASNSKVFLLFAAIFAQLAVIKVLFTVAMEPRTLDPQSAMLLVPYAFAPLICSVLLGKTQGLYAATFASLWSAVIYQSGKAAIFQGSYVAAFLVMSLTGGFVAVFLTMEVRRRSKLVRAGFFVGLVIWLLAMPLGIMYLPVELFPGLDWNTLGRQTLYAVGTGILTGIVVGGILPILESFFGITTQVSWLESADLNHPLLKRLTMEAPGTYHHSLCVANLSEAAAEAIGANATMCRVSAYFHDIGKLVKPDYFTENMNKGRNLHDDLAPTMSALIIIAHVKEGVDLALKHKLNQQIIDVIQEHHGNSLVYYFYKRALQQQEDARQGGKIMNIREEDIPEVREDSFRYPGPRPGSKECGIISLADAVESASRSLEKVSPARLEQLINDIIESRVIDHQLDDCELTLRDLRLIAESFRYTLQSMAHSRISYKSETYQQPPARNGRDAGTSRPASVA